MKRGRPGKRPPLVGSVRVPGDKSISHRALILAALADGTSKITGLNQGADVNATAAALQALGVPCRLEEGEAEVEGSGLAALSEAPDVIDAGNSGTTLRIMAGIAATIRGVTVLTGDESLRQRPMGRVIDPLRRMGASIEGREGDLPPVIVRGGDLVAVSESLPVASAQVKSALLVAGLSASGRTSVTEPAPSRDHTERMLQARGVALERSGTTVTVAGGQRVAPLDFNVPADISSALFLAVGALLTPGSELVIERVGINPTRTAAVEVLREMGGDITLEPQGDEGGEPVGSLTARASELHGVTVEGDRVPALIDEIPILAIAGAGARGETVFRDAGELRVKESDRIEALHQGFAALGIDSEPLHDGLVVRGGGELREGEIDSLGDHRIAMAFAVAAMIAGKRVRVLGWSCVETSFPGFLEVLAEARGARL